METLKIKIIKSVMRGLGMRTFVGIYQIPSGIVRLFSSSHLDKDYLKELGELLISKSQKDEFKDYNSVPFSQEMSTGTNKQVIPHYMRTKKQCKYCERDTHLECITCNKKSHYAICDNCLELEEDSHSQ